VTVQNGIFIALCGKGEWRLGGSRRLAAMTSLQTSKSRFRSAAQVGSFRQLRGEADEQLLLETK
jgi:hypothetical protein